MGWFRRKPELQVAQGLVEFFKLSMAGPTRVTIRITQLSELSDAMLATIRKQSPGEPMKDFVDRVGRVLTGTCPKCGQRLAGPGIVWASLSTEANEGSSVTMGQSARAQRVIEGKCFNPECSSRNLVLTMDWRDA